MQHLDSNFNLCLEKECKKTIMGNMSKSDQYTKKVAFDLMTLNHNLRNVSVSIYLKK